MSASQQDRYRPETRLVHSGTLRSQYGETSEALFLTQGYVYENSAQAERRFKNEEPGFQYSRFANPTVAMFEERMAAFEGAEAARATATGMAARSHRRISALIQIPLFNRACNAQDPFQPRSGAKGRRTWIANPCGSRFSASIVPPIATTLRRAIHNPIPK